MSQDTCMCMHRYHDYNILAQGIAATFAGIMTSSLVSKMHTTCVAPTYERALTAKGQPLKVCKTLMMTACMRPTSCTMEK